MRARKAHHVKPLDNDIVYAERQAVHHMNIYAKAAGIAALALASAGIGYVASGGLTKTGDYEYRDEKPEVRKARTAAGILKRELPGKSREERKSYLLEMEGIFGDHVMINALRIVQSPEMPITDFDYENYRRVYKEETGYDLPRDKTEGERELFSHMLDPVSANPFDRRVLAGVVLNRFGEAVGLDEYSQHLRRVEKSGGVSADVLRDLRNANNGEQPTREQYYDALWQRVVVPQYAVARDSSPRTGWSQNGQSGETRTYSFGQPDEVQRSYMDANSRNLNAERRAVNERSAREMTATANQVRLRAQNFAATAVNDLRNRQQRR